IDKLLGHPNLAVRLLAINQLIERGAEISLVKDEDLPDIYLAGRQWVRESTDRKKGIANFDRAYGSDHPIFGVHRDRIRRAQLEWEREHPLASKFTWSPALAKLDPKIARAAVEVMIEFPDSTYIAPPIIDLLKNCPAEDTHLRFAARVALRNCL